MLRPRTLRAVAHVVLSLAVIGCSANEDEISARSAKEKFSNQFDVLHGRNPIHEEITVDGLPFLRNDVKSFLAHKNAYADVYYLNGHPEAHFDSCSFMEAASNIQSHYRVALKNAKHFPLAIVCPDYSTGYCSATEDVTTGSVATSLVAFAYVLHAVQDFYSHTNWVENGLGSLPFENTLGLFSPLIPYSTINGLTIVEGDSPGWQVRTAPKNAVYPDSVLPKAQHSTTVSPG